MYRIFYKQQLKLFLVQNAYFFGKIFKVPTSRCSLWPPHQQPCQAPGPGLQTLLTSSAPTWHSGVNISISGYNNSVSGFNLWAGNERKNEKLGSLCSSRNLNSKPWYFFQLFSAQNDYFSIKIILRESIEPACHWGWRGEMSSGRRCSPDPGFLR